MKSKGETVMDMFAVTAAAAASSMNTMNVIDFSLQCSRTHFNRMRNSRSIQHFFVLSSRFDLITAKQ